LRKLIISETDSSSFHFTEEANVRDNRKKEFSIVLSLGLRSLCLAFLFLVFISFIVSLFFG